HLGDLGRITGAEREALYQPFAQPVLGGDVEGPLPREAAAERGEDVGRGRRAQSRGRRQADALFREVVALADGGAHALLAVRLQQPGGERDGELVGVAEAVAPGEAV